MVNSKNNSENSKENYFVWGVFFAVTCDWIVCNNDFLSCDTTANDKLSKVNYNLEYFCHCGWTPLNVYLLLDGLGYGLLGIVTGCGYRLVFRNPKETCTCGHRLMGSSQVHHEVKEKKRTLSQGWISLSHVHNCLSVHSP